MKKNNINKKNRKNNKIDTVEVIRTICFVLAIFLGIILIAILTKSENIRLLNRETVETSKLEEAKSKQNTIFSINKITMFSSCDSKERTATENNFTIENLFAYTDIALYINNNSIKNTLENTLKKVKLTNIKILKQPELGTPGLYYKSIDDFAKSKIEEKNLITNELEFKVTSLQEAKMEKPTLYNNCANPITLSYINQNIKNDYTMMDTKNPIIYNGKLLKRCNIDIENILATISFDIEIENNMDQKYKTNIIIDIPYQDGEKSIYDGNITINKNVDFTFNKCD